MPPYINLIHENGEVSLEGYFGRIWKTLETRLNFTSEIINEEFRDGVFYSRNGLRDVILHPSAVPSELVEHFHVSVPLLGSWYSIYIKDFNAANSSESFIKNWSIGLWVSTILMIFLFIITIYFTLNISCRFSSSNSRGAVRGRDRIAECSDFREQRNKNFNYRSGGNIKVTNQMTGEFQQQQMSNARRKNVFRQMSDAFISESKLKKKQMDNCELKSLHEGSLGNCFLIALAAFGSQGCSLSFRSTSVRMLILIFVVFGMIMRNSYSSLLVSQLTLRKRFLPFNTLEEIAYKAKDYSLCVRENSLPYRHFKNNQTSKALKSKWRNIINKKPCSKGIIPEDVLCAPYVAFLETPAIMGESISRNFKCKITNLKKKYFQTEFSILFIKRLTREIRYEINTEITRYREVGILRYLINKYVRHDDLASPGEDSLLHVTFDHIRGILLVYGCCICGSFIILLLELFLRQMIYQSEKL